MADLDLGGPMPRELRRAIAPAAAAAAAGAGIDEDEPEEDEEDDDEDDEDEDEDDEDEEDNDEASLTHGGCATNEFATTNAVAAVAGEY